MFCLAAPINRIPEGCRIAGPRGAAHICLCLSISALLLLGAGGCIPAAPDDAVILPDNACGDYLSVDDAQLSEAQDLQHYLNVQPDARVVLLRLGRIQADQKQFDEAAKTLQTLIEVAPEDPVAYFELGQVLENQHKYKCALDLYRNAAAILHDSIQEFEYLQAKLLLQRQEFAAAAKVLKKSLEREESVPLRLLYGYALLNMEEYAAAVPELRAAAEALEFNPMAWLWLGQALEQQQRWHDAIAAFQQVDQGEARTQALLHLAGLYHVVGYNQDAIQTLHELLDSAGVSDPLLYQYLSYLYTIEDENAAALAVLERGLEEYPESIELQYRLGLLHAMMDNHTAALKHMQIVAQQRPADIEVMNNLAYLYAQTGQNLEYAATLARTALNQEERAEFHDTLGWIYFKQRRYDEALIHLRKARDMRPDDPHILEHLARVYAARGEHNRAVDVENTIEKLQNNK